MFFTINTQNISIFFVRCFYGALIGASVMVPGLSGGTTALILGVFSDIMNSVEAITREFKKSIAYLFPFATGGVLGLFSVSFLLKSIIENYYIYFSHLIIGIIIGSVPVFLPQKNKVSFPWTCLYVASGMIPVFIQYFIPVKDGTFHLGIVFTVFVGLLSAVALILPGISLTNILLSIGYYEKLITALAQLDMLFLLIYGGSMLLGVALTVKALVKAYEKHTDIINLILLGMVLGSLVNVFKGFPVENEILPCLLLMFGGGSLSFIAARYIK